MYTTHPDNFTRFVIALKRICKTKISGMGPVATPFNDIIALRVGSATLNDIDYSINDRQFWLLMILIQTFPNF